MTSGKVVQSTTIYRITKKKPDPHPCYVGRPVHVPSRGLLWLPKYTCATEGLPQQSPTGRGFSPVTAPIHLRRTHINCMFQVSQLLSSTFRAHAVGCPVKGPPYMNTHLVQTHIAVYLSPTPSHANFLEGLRSDST